MTKITKKKTNNCERHQFSLKPKGEYTMNPQYYQVSFCQLHQEKDKKSQTDHNSQCLNCPIFNKDHNFATPTFILNKEQAVDETQGQRLKQQHERRMVYYTDQKSSINVPKPRSKNHFCSVCRQNYGDYLQHIQSPAHKKKIKASDFNKHILQLTQKFSSSVLQNVPQINNKNSSIVSTAVKQSVGQDNESVQIISNPQKKIKINTEEAGNLVNNRVQAEWNNYYSQPYQTNLYPFNQIPTINNTATAMAQTFLPRYNIPLSNYNFNINMNLFLNNMPNYLNPTVYPYLNLEYQHLLMNQLNNQLVGISCNPNGLYTNCPSLNSMNYDCQGGLRTKPRQVSYIVIDQ